MKKKNPLILLISITLFNCNSHLNKSVIEPLTVKELKKTIDSDSLFKNTYEYIVYLRDTVIKNDLDKVKFTELTYNQVIDFVEFSSDTTYFKPINERIEKEWNNKYGIYKKQVDSVSNYWKKFKQENSLEKYVKIELVKIDKEYYTYSRDIRNVNLGFKLTPLKGKIEQIRFGFNIVAKINEKEKNDEYSSIYSALDKSWCRSTSPFSRPVVRYWEASYSDEKILKHKSLKTLLRDYNIHIEVDKIRKNGKNISRDDLNIPESIENHWKYENHEKEYLQDLYFDDVVKEVLNKEYVEKYTYRNKEIDIILKKEFPLVFDFLRFQHNKK